MTPLWIRANLPSLLRWGWALASVTPPWVAQRVWPIPVVPVNCRGAMAFAMTSTRPAFLTTSSLPSWRTATPAES